MARSESVTCDVCGKIKGATNHWFVVGQKDSCVYIVTGGDVRAGVPPGGEGIVVDACGESCVLKKVSELIGGKA